MLDAALVLQLVNAALVPQLLDTPLVPQLLDTPLVPQLLDTPLVPQLLDAPLVPQLLDAPLAPQLPNGRSQSISVSCSSQGFIWFHVSGKKGQFVWTEGRDEEALSRGVYNTYTGTNLRYSQVGQLHYFQQYSECMVVLVANAPVMFLFMCDSRWRH